MKKTGKIIAMVLLGALLITGCGSDKKDKGEALSNNVTNASSTDAQKEKSTQNSAYFFLCFYHKYFHHQFF